MHILRGHTGGKVWESKFLDIGGQIVDIEVSEISEF